MKPPAFQLVDIPDLADGRGGLCVAELGGALPFPVRRAYWLHSTARGARRGFHAHRQLRQLCVCLSGSVTFRLDDGSGESVVSLDSPSRGLLLGPGVWREMGDFAPGAVLLVLADAEYDEADYIREREAFLREHAR